jgi:hypothetical protein
MPTLDDEQHRKPKRPLLVSSSQQPNHLLL